MTESKEMEPHAGSKQMWREGPRKEGSDYSPPGRASKVSYGMSGLDARERI